MANISRVQLAVDSSQVRTATSSLGRMQRAGVDTQRGMDAMRRTVTRLGAAIAAAFSVRQIQRFTSTAISEFADLERSQLRLTRQIELMGHQSWLSADAVEEMASRIDRATLASADGVRQAASMMITNGDLTQESFERTMQVAVDMGEVFGLALPTSARYLTRAMSDAGGAMSMFRRYGVELGEAVEDNIKQLADAGRESEAYALLLSELEDRFEGAAEAAGAGLAGSLDDLSRASREARENIGDQLAPAIDAVVTALTEWVDANAEVEGSGLQEFALNTATALSYVVDVVHGVGRAFAIVGRGIALGTLEWQRDFLDVADSIINGPIRALNDMIELYNRIPMLPNLGEVGMTGLGDTVAAELAMIERAVIEAEIDLEDAIMTPLEGQRLRDSIAEVREAMEEGRDEADQSADALRNLGDQQDGYAAATERAAEETRKARGEVDRLGRDLESLRRKLDPVYAATVDYMQSVETLNEAWAKGLITGEEYDRLVWDLAEGTEEATERTRDLRDEADPLAIAYEEAIRRIDNLFVDLWESAFRGFDSFVDGVKRTFRRMLAEMAHAATKNQIMIMLGIGGSSASSTAMAASGMSGGGLLGTAGSLWQGGGMLSGIGGAVGYGLNYGAASLTGAGAQQSAMLASQTGPFGAHGAAATYQAGGGLGAGGGMSGAAAGAGAIGGGLAGGYIAGQMGGDEMIGGMAGAGLAYVGGVTFGPIGAVVGAIVGGLIGGALGGKRSIEDYGLDAGVRGGEVIGDQFTTVKRRGGWFSSDSYSDRLSDIDPDLRDQLQGGVDDLLTRMAEVSNSIEEGLADRLHDFNAPVQRLSMRGLSDDARPQARAEWLGGVANAAAEHVGGVNLAGGQAHSQRIDAGQFQDMEQFLRGAMNFARETEDVSILREHLQRVEDVMVAAGRPMNLDRLFTQEIAFRRGAGAEGEMLGWEAHREWADDIRETAVGALHDAIEEAAEFDYETPSIASFRREGEEAWQTLERLAGTLSTFNQWMQPLREGWEDLTGIEVAGWAEEFAGSLGGLEQAGERISAYFQSFYTQQERNAANWRLSVSQMHRAAENFSGETVPRTREGFRELADGLDLTTDSGRELFGELMNLMPAWNATIGLIEDVRGAVQSTLSSTAEMIHQDLMGEQELYEYRRSHVDSLVAALDDMTDPREIQQTIDIIDDLTRQMWQSLEDSQREAMGGGFLDFLEETNELAQERLDHALENLDEDMGRLGEDGGRFEAAAMQMNDAAERYSLSAEKIAQAASDMRYAADTMNQQNQTVTRAPREVEYA